MSNIIDTDLTISRDKPYQANVKLEDKQLPSFRYV